MSVNYSTAGYLSKRYFQRDLQFMRRNFEHGCVQVILRMLLSNKITKNIDRSCSHPIVLFLPLILNKNYAQREIFQGSGSFVELGHFDKHFVKSTRNKGPVGKNFEVFSPRYF